MTGKTFSHGHPTQLELPRKVWINSSPESYLLTHLFK